MGQIVRLAAVVELAAAAVAVDTDPGEVDINLKAPAGMDQAAEDSSDPDVVGSQPSRDGRVLLGEPLRAAGRFSEDNSRSRAPMVGSSGQDDTAVAH